MSDHRFFSGLGVEEGSGWTEEESNWLGGN